MLRGAKLIGVLALLCAIGLAVSAAFHFGGGQTAAPELQIFSPGLGKADCFLLVSESDTVLIDTGEDPDAEAILQLLEEQGIDRLSDLILTHYDKDHIGGAAAILGRVPVGVVWRTAYAEDCPAALTRAIARSGADDVVLTGDDYDIHFGSGGVVYTLYPPLEEAYDKNGDNNASLIVSLSAGGQELLFMGDAQKQRVKEFLREQYDGTAYTFLKVPHHGGDTRTLALLLERFTPADALITSSDEEPEDPDLVQLLEKQDINVWRTREGSLTFSLSGGDLTALQTAGGN